MKDALFVTLDSSVGSLIKYNPQGSKNPEGLVDVVVSDTIGFIQNLPLSLIDSFKSTLLESIGADIILHIIDASDQKVEEKIKTVEEITNQLGIATKKQFYVFNKTDKLDDQRLGSINRLRQKYSNFLPQFISVKTSAGIGELKQRLLKLLEPGGRIELPA